MAPGWCGSTQGRRLILARAPRAGQHLSTSECPSTSTTLNHNKAQMTLEYLKPHHGKIVVQPGAGRSKVGDTGRRAHACTHQNHNILRRLQGGDKCRQIYGRVCVRARVCACVWCHVSSVVSRQDCVAQPADSEMRLECKHSHEISKSVPQRAIYTRSPAQLTGGRICLQRGLQRQLPSARR